MLRKDVKIGGVYVVKVSGKLAPVKIKTDLGKSANIRGRGELHRGWVGINTKTGREIRVRSAAKLRMECPTVPIPESGCCEEMRDIGRRWQDKVSKVVDVVVSKKPIKGCMPVDITVHVPTDFTEDEIGYVHSLGLSAAQKAIGEVHTQRRWLAEVTPTTLSRTGDPADAKGDEFEPE